MVLVDGRLIEWIDDLWESCQSSLVVIVVVRKFSYLLVTQG